MTNGIARAIAFAIAFLIGAPFRLAAVYAELGQVAGVAQGPEAESIAHQLTSRDPKGIAWAGYRAGENRVKDAVPNLVDALSSPELRQPGIEWSAARNAVLDALIRLGGHPPLDVLDSFYPEHREQVLILLAEPRPGRDELLLKLLRGESGIPWYAIAGLLLEAKAPGLAAELIRGLRLTLDVRVVDGPPQEGPSSGFGVGGGIGDGVLYPAPGYPSIATYSLWNSAVRGAIVLAEGPHPIYYTRKASPPDSIPSGASSLTIEAPSAQDRLKYFEELVEHWLPLEAVEEVTFKWTTAQRLRTDIAKHRETMNRKYREMLRLAQKANVLTADQAKNLVPFIDVRLNDLRRNKSARLPDVSR